MPRTNRHTYGERAFWVKNTEANMVRKRRLTAIIRPGDRSDQILAPQQWLPLMEPIPVYLIAVPGDQAKGIPAQFEPDDGTAVKIVRRTVTRLGDVIIGDLIFAPGTAVPMFVDGVKQYLEEELAPGKTFSLSDLLTVYWVEYLPNETPASD